MSPEQGWFDRFCDLRLEQFGLNPHGSEAEQEKAALARLVAESVDAERRKCINEVRAFPDCKCAGFCECYGRKSFTILADQMETKIRSRQRAVTEGT